MAKRLIFNGKQYAELKSKDLGDCNGYFQQRINGGIGLYKPDRSLEAFIVNNPRQGQFVVSAGTNSSGTPYYMFSTSSLTEAWLGMTDMGMADSAHAIQQMSFVDAEEALDATA